MSISGVPLCLLCGIEKLQCDLKMIVNHEIVSHHKIFTQEESKNEECMACSLRSVCSGFLTWHRDFSFFYGNHLKASRMNCNNLIKTVKSAYN
jgi:hypothetical protein